MRWRVRQYPADDWRLVGVRWRHVGAVHDLAFGWGRRELACWWEQYGEVPMGGRARYAWYWALVIGMILLLGWFVAQGRP